MTHFGIEHDLDEAFTIPQIGKDNPAVISPPVDPTHQNDLPINVGGADTATVVGTLAQC
jgi:hypothetical protein